MFKDGRRILQPSVEIGGSRGICWFPTGSGDGKFSGLMMGVGCGSRSSATVAAGPWDPNKTGLSSAVPETAIKTRPIRAARSLQRLMSLGIPVAYRRGDGLEPCGYHPSLKVHTRTPWPRPTHA